MNKSLIPLGFFYFLKLEIYQILRFSYFNKLEECKAILPRRLGPFRSLSRELPLF